MVRTTQPRMKRTAPFRQSTPETPPLENKNRNGSYKEPERLLKDICPKNKDAIPNNVGRPPIYDPEVTPALGYRFALLGATDEDMASVMDVSISVLESWKREKPEFRMALRDGKVLADANVAQRLYSRATGFEVDDMHISAFMGVATLTPTKKYYPPDVRAAEYWLNNRQRGRWSNRQEHDMKSTDGSMTPQPTVVVLPAKREIRNIT